MSLDLDSLERVAREATKRDSGWYSLDAIGRGLFHVAPPHTIQADATFIATLSPDKALELIARIRELEAERDAIGEEVLRTHALITEVHAAVLATPSGDAPREEAESEPL